MKQNKKIVALTGSISTGKSAVTKILRDLGEIVIDLDEIGHRVLKDSKVICDIEKNFGKEFIDDGIVDRTKLGPVVFNNKEKLEILNSIMHKRIFDVMKEEIDNIDSDLIFVDIPLLFEIRENLKWYEFKPDVIWVVYVDRETQIQRLMERDSIDYEYATSKINSQMSIEDKKILADTVIDNSGSLENLKENVMENLDKLKN